MFRSGQLPARQRTTLSSSDCAEGSSRRVSCFVGIFGLSGIVRFVPCLESLSSCEFCRLPVVCVSFAKREVGHRASSQDEIPTTSVKISRLPRCQDGLAVRPDWSASVVGVQLQPRAGLAGSQQHRSQLQRTWLGHFHPRHRRILARPRAVHLSRQKKANLPGSKWTIPVIGKFLGM